MRAIQSILQRPLAFVDIETTGGSPLNSRVLELGVVRVEGGRVVGEMRTLVDAGDPVPPWITGLTGIKTEDLAGAPSFREVAEELAELLEGAVFVAHNVSFDYGFLRAEFDRLGAPFRPVKLCTVRLSRALYPEYRNHKLQDLIDRFGLATEARHRAFDDAMALWQFWQIVLRDFDLDTVEMAVGRQLKTQTLPSHLDRSLIDNLPEAPGVYIYEDEAGAPLYVGKSVNIRGRVQAHFASVHERMAEQKLAQTVARIRTIETHGELGALLTESNMVKELQPLYNRALRRRERVTIALRHRTPEGYATLSLRDADRIEAEDGPNLLGVFTTVGAARRSLHTTARNFYLCPKLLGLEKARGACFQLQLKKCFGACSGTEPPKEYNSRFETAFERHRVDGWPYEGPILLTESRPGLPGSEGFLIDQWVILARLRELEDGAVETVRQDYAFDMDMYRILRGQLAKPGIRRQVRVVAPQELAKLA